MHPILVKRERLVLYLVAWIPVAALLSGQLVFSGHLTWGKSALLAGPMAFIYANLCLPSWYLCRAFPIGKTALLNLFGIYGAAAVFSSSLWMLIGKGWAGALSTIPALADLSGSYAAQIPLLFVVGILLFVLAVTVHYLMSLFENSREAERRTLETKILAREAELKVLKAQIDPHFLFNSLNSISALTTIDPAKSRSMCQLLADFLRRSLDVGVKELIPLDEELSLASSYLAVERVRLGPRLSIREEIREDSRTCLVPPLLLQPLVENAVRHGIAQLLEGGEILISARKAGSRLEVRVANPVEPDKADPRKNGIGISNVRSRLQTLFGSEAGLDLRSGSGRFEAVLTLPALVQSGEERRA